MSVIIKKVQNQTEGADSFGKYYPRVVNVGTIGLNELCEHIQEHGSVWTDDVVSGVVKKFLKCIQEQLLNSHKVKLDGLGTFYLRALLKVGVTEKGYAKYGGVSDEKDLLMQNVDFRVGFQPDMGDDSRFVGPNISSKAARKSIAALGLSESEDDETTNSGSSSGGSNTGGGSNTSGTTTGGDEPGEDRP